MYYATLTEPARIVFLDGTEFVRGIERPVTKELYELLKTRGNYYLRTEVVEDAEKELKPADDPDKGKKPKTRQEITAAILEAVGKLDVDDKDSFLADGRPDARALSKVLGWQVTSVDRDEALKASADTTPRKGIVIRRKNAGEIGVLDTGEARASEGRGDLTPSDIDPTTDGAITV